MLAVEKYRITGENIYNFDEKGFMIGVGITSVRVMSLEEMRSGKIIGVNQDGNREWVFLLATIYAVAIKIPSCFIY